MMSNDFPQKLEIVAKIQSEFPMCMVGGSFVLNHFNIINRSINDLDIIIPIKYKKHALDYFKPRMNLKNIFLYIYENFSNIVNLTKNTDDNHIKIKYDDTKICLFFVEYNDCYKLNINNEYIQITKLNRIIDAKQLYISQETQIYASASKIKHENDIEQYNKKKKTVERYIKSGIITNEIVEIEL